MGKDINAIFDTGGFNRIVMGVVTVAMRECQEALDNLSAEEFEQAYHEYLVSGK